MRLVCVRRNPVSLGGAVAAYKQPDRTEYDLIVGQEYVAMGLGFWDAKAWMEIATVGGFLLSVPLTEFEVVSGKPSSFWELRVTADDAILLWPPSFYKATYHSELADRVPSVVEDFEYVRQLLEKEDGESPRQIKLER